jgi:C1A family cysteine protease
LNNLQEIKSSLQKYGPVVAGITLYAASMKDKGVHKTGIIPDPSPGDKAIGAQAICIVGYDDDKKLVKFKNSWGPEWGDNGYGYMSYNYVEKFLSDAWTFTI